MNATISLDDMETVSAEILTHSVSVEEARKHLLDMIHKWSKNNS